MHMYILQILNADLFRPFFTFFTGNLLLQKLHISFISHKTKRTIDRVFPDYNIALREIAIAAAIQKANIEKERRKEQIYRASFLGISSRIINRIIPDFGFSRFFKTNIVSNERKSTGNGTEEKSEKEVVTCQIDVINSEREKAK
jgi:hypothetical protein